MKSPAYLNIHVSAIRFKQSFSMVFSGLETFSVFKTLVFSAEKKSKAFDVLNYFGLVYRQCKQIQLFVYL